MPASNLSTNIASCFHQLNEFRKVGKHCDVIININGQQFPCHRLVLSSASSYFSVMFNGTFDESKANSIEIRDVDPIAFAELLEAMYVCRITLNKENVCRILKTCSLLGVPIYEKACVTFINDFFPPDNLLEIGAFCRTLGHVDMVDRIVKHVAEEFSDFCKMKQFESVPQDMLIAILSQTNLQRDEEAILKNIVAWVNKNKCDIAAIEKLLDVANLSTVSLNVIAKLIRKAENVDLNSDDETEAEQSQRKKIRLEVALKGQKLMAYVKSMRLDTGIRGTCTFALTEKGQWVAVDHEISSLTTLKTVVIGRRQYFLGCDKNVATGLVNMFWCVEDGKSIRLREPPITVSHFKLTSIDNTIYLYISERGIIRDSDVVSSLTMHKDGSENGVYAYNCDLDMWFSIPRMYTVTYGSAAVASNRDLYVLGGGSEGGALLIAQRYDHRSPNWFKLPSLLFNHNNADACEFSDRIYLSGSYHESMFHTTFTSFNIAANKWEALKGMNTGRGNHTFVTYQDMLYVFDNRPFSVNEKYHARSNTWSDVAAFPKRIAVNGEIVATYEVNDAVSF